jgi:hypothetical protein
VLLKAATIVAAQQLKNYPRTWERSSDLSAFLEPPASQEQEGGSKRVDPG